MKTSRKYYFIPIDWKKFKSLITHMLARIWENNMSFSTAESVNIYMHFGEQFHII